MSGFPVRAAYHATVSDSALRAAVIDAATEFVLENGPDEFNMRVLATRLGVSAPTLYRRVGDKNTLLAIVVNEVVAEISTPDQADGTVRERITGFATAHFRLLSRHPILLEIFAKGVVNGPNLLRNVETWLRLFAEMGLSPTNAVHAFKAIIRHIVGSAPQFASATGFDGNSSISELEMLTETQYPLIRPVRAELSADYYSLRDFDVGLRIVLAGIEALVEVPT